MSIYEIRSTLTHKWFARKSKDELVRIVWANIDKIDIFADEFRTEMEQRIAHLEAELASEKEIGFATSAELEACRGELATVRDSYQTLLDDAIEMRELRDRAK